MNKKGFTLVELLAVIVLLGVVALIAIPNIVKLFTDNKSSLSKIQKDQLKSAVELYIKDYCTEPINDDYDCEFETETTSTYGIIKVKDTVSGSGLPLKTLSDNGYFNEEDILHNCEGTIGITNGEVDLSRISCDFNN